MKVSPVGLDRPRLGGDIPVGHDDVLCVLGQDGRLVAPSASLYAADMTQA
ncbi:MAG: hypothetical protein QOE57_3452 [Acidimicrobiaceae bacterium]|nr:hypothetical protein [Acidimicrobiaceae bacterium]